MSSMTPNAEPGQSSTAATMDDAGEELKRQGQRFSQETTSAVKSAARGYRDSAAGFIEAVASATSSGADELRRQGHEGCAKMVTQASREVTGFAQRLTQREPTEILNEVEGFARRNPALFFGAALLAGFGAMRFLKSSSPDPGPSFSAGNGADASGQSHQPSLDATVQGGL